MKMDSAEIFKYGRKFLRPWKTSAGEINERRGIFLKITEQNGLIGIGEAAPLEGFSRETTGVAENALETAVEIIAGNEIGYDREEIATFSHKLINQEISTARFALETALCDLAARNNNKKLSEFLCESPRKSVPVNYTATYLEDVDKVVYKIRRRGYTVIKVKAGVGRVDEEIEYINHLALKSGKSVRFRLDANRGWSFDDAVTFLGRIRNLNIDYVEEPLKVYDAARYRQLKAKVGRMIALDESLTGHDIDDIIGQDFCDVLILKPGLVGGIFRTMEIARKAQSAGKKVVISSLLECEVGLAALLHLAAAIPNDLPPCGLDTIHVFESVPEDLFVVEDGNMKVPDQEYGLGIEPGIIDKITGVE
jgi:o-succinylbenzoate synthase